jgi:hypothetical protein
LKRRWPHSLAMLLGLVLLGSYAGCGRPKLPEGPPPDYERPQLEPWDAAPTVDPFEAAEGEGGWVEEAPPKSPGGAGAPPAQ